MKNKLLCSMLVLFQHVMSDYPPSGAMHNVAVDFQGTFSMLNELNICDATLITAAMIGTSGYTISTSGNYRLSENISFTPSSSGAAITINASNVNLDLGCYMISQANGQSGVSAILTSSSVSKITITGGTISNFTQAALEISGSVSRHDVHDVRCYDNARGVYYNGSSGQPITQSRLSDIELVQSGTAIDSNYLQFSTIKDILALQSLSAGFDLKNSFTNLLSAITIDGVNNAGTTYGINLQGGANNIVQNGLVRAVSTSATDTQNNTYGIRIASDEYADVIQNMQISNIITTSNAQAFGIMMNPITDVAMSNTGVPSTSLTTAGSRVSWSSNGRYIAVASTASGSVYIFEYTGSGLNYITSITGSCSDASWSSDSSYLAVANSTSLQIYSFNGTALSLVTSADHTTAVQAVAWSYDNRYAIVAGTQAGDGNSVRIYAFTGSSLTSILGINTGGTIQRVKFANNSYVFALCGPASNLRVYSFNPAASTSTLLASIGSGVAIWNDLDWSYDNRYILVAQGNNNTANVYIFDGSNLYSLANYNHGAAVGAVAWSPTGRNVIIGGSASGGVTARNLRFDGQDPLVLINSLSTGGVNGISWSPTGVRLVFAGLPSTVLFTQGYDFSSGHSISDCTINTVQTKTASGFSSIATSNGVGMQVSTEGSVATNNAVSFSDVPYVTTALERYQEFLLNLATRNQFPNKLSNASFPPVV